MHQKSWKKMFAKGRLCTAAMIVSLAVLMAGCGNTKEEEPEAEPVETEQQAEEPEPEPNNLEENSHASITRLMEEYCECIANGDVDKLEKLVDVLTDEEKEKIQARSSFIEAFENINCYTKNGPEPDSYIVFLCYDMKLTNIKTPAPDIVCLYVSAKDEDGDRYIHYGDAGQDAELQSYVSELENDPEVKALYEDVSARYQEAMDSDEMLREYIQGITGQLSEDENAEEESSEETSAEETPAEEAPAEETEQAEESPAEESQSTGEVNRKTRVTESVNVRAEASTDSERLALAYQGEEITQIEAYDDGWSKVEYNGMTGYVKTEFLE